MPRTNDPLDRLLDGWKQTPPPPPSLRAEVWRRISVAESSEEAGFWKRLDEVFARPSFAVAFVAAFMLAGLFVAEVRLSKLHAERSAALAQSYLKLIDPLITDTQAGGGDTEAHSS